MWRHGDGRGHLIHPVLQWRPNVASKLQDHHRDERLLKVRSRNEWNMELTKHVCTLVKLLYNNGPSKLRRYMCAPHNCKKTDNKYNTYIHLFIYLLFIYLLQHVPCMVVYIYFYKKGGTCVCNHPGTIVSAPELLYNSNMLKLK